MTVWLRLGDPSVHLCAPMTRQQHCAVGSAGPAGRAGSSPLYQLQLGGANSGCEVQILVLVAFACVESAKRQALLEPSISPATQTSSPV